MENLPEVARLVDLEQNYPNPFTPATTIPYSVTRPAFVTLTVYDVLGRAVATLVDGFKAPGRYTVRFDAGSLPGGVYIYRLETDRASRTRSLLLLK